MHHRIDDKLALLISAVHVAHIAETRADSVFTAALGEEDYDKKKVAVLDAARKFAGAVSRDALLAYFEAREKADGRALEPHRALRALGFVDDEVA